MGLNPDQRSYVESLNRRPRAELCPCGWYTEKECSKKCYTGTRDNAPMLVARIRQIYRDIDRANSTK